MVEEDKEKDVEWRKMTCEVHVRCVGVRRGWCAGMYVINK